MPHRPPVSTTAATAFCSIVALLVVIWFTITEGDNGLSLGELLGTVPTDDFKFMILKQIRLPRMICAIGVGALLSISGFIMQSVFRNPIVEPFTMGVSGGAVAGVATMFACGAVAAIGSPAILLGAGLGAILTIIAVLALRRAVGQDNTTTLLAGVMISFIASAATMILLSLGPQEQTAQVTAWTMGSFANVSPDVALPIGLLSTITILASPLTGNILNVISLGEDESSSLGINHSQATKMLFLASGILAAVCVATAGVVAFVGMAVPQVALWASHSDARRGLPLSGLIGAATLALFDLIAKKAISPLEIPVGAVTALAGGVAFIIIIIRWRSQKS